jgi:hypothetical protein
MPPNQIGANSAGGFFLGFCLPPCWSRFFGSFFFSTSLAFSLGGRLGCARDFCPKIDPAPVIDISRTSNHALVGLAMTPILRSVIKGAHRNDHSDVLSNFTYILREAMITLKQTLWVPICGLGAN